MSENVNNVMFSLVLFIIWLQVSVANASFNDYDNEFGSGKTTLESNVEVNNILEDQSDEEEGVSIGSTEGDGSSVNLESNNLAEPPSKWLMNTKINNARLLMDEHELNGTNRVAFDSVINVETCQTLKALVQKIAIKGDGYRRKNSEGPSHPHTKRETFSGVGIDAAVEAYEGGKASFEEVYLYFNISEKVRLLTQEYFNLERLNIAFTHLVCRTAVKELDEDEEIHMSHPIHSDNCLVNQDGPGTCPKRTPAYTWRDYSAILYLNSGFEGGEFLFADYLGYVSAEVEPECGRMVAFKSEGVENLHGVWGLRKGVRCALPLWFTLSDYSEDSRDYYEQRLRTLRKEKLNNREEL